MYQVSSLLTFDHARSVLHAGRNAIAAGQSAFDFSSVEAVDSSAVAVVLAWQRFAKEQGGALVLHHLPASLSSLLKLYDVASLLEFGDARADLPHH